MWERTWIYKSIKLREYLTTSPQKDFLQYKIAKSMTKKNFKGNQGKRTVTYKGTLIRLLADFSAETLQARRE